MLIEIFNDDRGFRDGPVQGFIAENWKLAEWPNVDEVRARIGVGEVNDMAGEGSFVLVKRHQHLVTERSEGVEIEHEVHRGSVLVAQLRIIENSRNGRFIPPVLVYGLLPYVR